MHFFGSQSPINLSQANGSSESYWIISNDLWREKRLSGSFDREVYNVLDGKEVSAEAYQLALVTITTDDNFGYGIETVEEEAEEEEEENDDVSHTGEYTMEDDVLPPATEEVGSNPLKEGNVKDNKAKSIPSPTPISGKLEVFQKFALFSTRTSAHTYSHADFCAHSFFLLDL
ncbi:putative magnesium protoporphyrin IX methyltransferase, chloroplastic-like [Capsicum annuum]|uniref:Uncharacterized protein n=1 Tax=Capsicum annuum TaxID=4072 RepID=A0A2G2Y0C2_CAPAN|nr:putative magnesium protoporphyrin IX methyltransferase, chloroplastic-like [Capsicum annuum]KAF3633552.1 putative magnesium protoporphyrin IX methyltransferase, chloroplastic-like [Capsicum annuum]PHT63159.1 hypothetical protein T459_32968 [Capsicum annuum]